MTSRGGRPALPVCVVDASVLVKLFLAEDDSDLASSLMSPVDRSVRLIRAAPQFLELECANVFWKRVRRGTLAEAEAHNALAELQALGIELWPDALLTDLALELALILDVTVYDAAYLALSSFLDVPFVSADERLLRKAGGPNDRLILLSSLR